MTDPTMNFGPDMQPAGTTDSGAAAPAAPSKAPTTEAQLGDLLTERQKIAAQMIELSKNGSFGDVIVGMDDYNQPIMGASGDSLKITALAKSFDAIGELAKLGAGDKVAASGDGGLSANTMAQIAQQERQLQESMREFDITTGQSASQHADTLAFNREQLGANIDESQKNRAETQRQNNLSSTLDLLTNQIKVGELGVNEASNRITAATQAAGIQRDILANHAGKALPAGTTTFPNLGANGPIAAAAQALGMPFKPFQTLGTFAIDPNAIAAPISSAAGQSVIPGVNANVQAAAAALAGMGVPHMAAGGMVEGPYLSGENGPELNFPMGNGRNFVLPNHALQGGASIPQGEIPGQGHPWNTQPGANQNPWGGQQWSGQPLMDPSGGGGSPWDSSRSPFASWYDQLQSRVPPALLQRIQQMLAGIPYGTPPPSPGGAQLRPPQMGGQAAAQSMAGG